MPAGQHFAFGSGTLGLHPTRSGSPSHLASAEEVLKLQIFGLQDVYCLKYN